MSTFGSVFELSSLDGSNGFKVSTEAAERLGYSVASAGDINGDGFDDIVLGAPSGGNTGATYVLYGAAGGFSSDLSPSMLNGTNGFRINGEAAGDNAGVSVASAGDVNGDGFDDLIVGAPYADPNGSNSGASYVVFGAAGGFAANLNLSTLNGTNGFRINGEVADDRLGRSVASAGDVNGDGIDDLIIGAFLADPNNRGSGASYVVFGAAGGFAANLNLSTLNGTNGFQINGEAMSNNSGRSVASAGDVNGDGFDDLIIGARRASPNGIYSGASYVVFGAARGFAANLNLSTLNGTNGFQINGEVAWDYSGISVASAGDFNSDGFDDLIIGAFRADAPDDMSGASYVVFGSAGGFAADLDLSTVSGTTGFKVNGDQWNARTGFSVASAGDINGDGFDDLIVGAWGADVSPGIADAGASYVIFGTASVLSTDLTPDSLNGSNGFRIYGENWYDRSGYSVASAGDVNGDGFDDLIIGAHRADPSGSYSRELGASYVIFGRAPDTAVTRVGTDVGNTIRGGAFNDTISGLGGDDRLFGGAGRDSVISGTGNDTLIGGAGLDRLTGGAGRDVFEFISISDMTTRERTTDVIADFRRGQDKIDLSGIDASTVRPTDDAFLFRGKAAIGTNTAGEVSYKQFNLAGRKNDYTLVYIDTDGDRAAEGVIKVMGLHNFALGDFIL